MGKQDPNLNLLGKPAWAPTLGAWVKFPRRWLERQLGKRRVDELEEAGCFGDRAVATRRPRLDFVGPMHCGAKELLVYVELDGELLASILKLDNVRLPEAFKRTLESLIDGQRMMLRLEPANPLSEEL